MDTRINIHLCLSVWIFWVDGRDGQETCSRSHWWILLRREGPKKRKFHGVKTCHNHQQESLARCQSSSIRKLLICNDYSSSISHPLLHDRLFNRNTIGSEEIDGQCRRNFLINAQDRWKRIPATMVKNRRQDSGQRKANKTIILVMKGICEKLQEMPPRIWTASRFSEDHLEEFLALAHIKT